MPVFDRATVDKLTTGTPHKLPDQLGTLTGILDHGEWFARQWCIGRGPDEMLRPMVIVISKNNSVVPITVASEFDDDGKDAFAHDCRQMMREIGARRYVMLTEAWFVTQAHGVPLTARPSQRDDRKECISLTAGDRKGSRGRVLLIKRERPSGRIVDLVRDHPDGDDSAGRFANLLK